jgi:hypothetical protein
MNEEKAPGTTGPKLTHIDDLRKLLKNCSGGIVIGTKTNGEVVYGELGNLVELSSAIFIALTSKFAFEDLLVAALDAQNAYLAGAHPNECLGIIRDALTPKFDPLNGKGRGVE